MFYVTDLTNRKIDGETRQASIKERLTEILREPEAEDVG